MWSSLVVFCCQVMRGEGRRVSYAYFKAFNQMLNNLDLLEEAVATATEAAAPHTAVTMEQVQAAARKYPQVVCMCVVLVCLFGVCDVTLCGVVHVCSKSRPAVLSVFRVGVVKCLC